MALDTFDTAWASIRDTDFDPGHGGVDWEEVKLTYRPKAAACTDNEALREVIDEMIGTLGRSHFALLPQEAVDARVEAAESGAAPAPAASAPGATAVDGSDRGDGAGGGSLVPASFGMGLRLVEGSIVVCSVLPGGPADHAGVKPGWAVTAVAGRDPLGPFEGVDEGAGGLARYEREAAIAAMDRSRAGREVGFTFRTVDGQERTLGLTAAPFPAEVAKFGNLPPLPVVFESRWLSPEELKALGVPASAADGRPLRVGYIHFNIWLIPVAARLEKAVDELRSADGIVLDLRGNPGGVGGMVMGVGGHFFTESASLGSMRTREGTMEFRVNPRTVTADGRLVDPYAGPLAILVDPLSASTSEVFAGGMQDVKRARIFGETSAGAVLPAHTTRLPNGDVLLHAVADFQVPSGIMLEGRGVIPDQPRALTRAQIAETGDPVLADAVQWIASGPAR
ncbi:MAG: S41 family peptidase [Phycisphaerales bacterium]